MLVLRDLVKIHHGFHACVERAEDSGPLVPRPRPEDGAESLLDHRRVRFQYFAVFPLRVPHSFAERREELGLQRPDAHVLPVRSLIKVIDPSAVQKTTLPCRHRSSGKIGSPVHGIKGDDAVLHGDVDELPLSCPLPIDDRGKYARDRVHGSAGDIRDLEIVEGGAPFAAPCRPGDAGPRQIVDIVARFHGEGAVLPVARNSAVDHSRIDLPKLPVTYAEFFHDARPELFDDDVVLHDQLLDRLHRCRLLQVQEHGLLIAAEPRLCPGHLRSGNDRRPVHDKVVLVPSADLEHFGAHIRQSHRRVRPRQERSEIQYFVSV